MDLSKKYTHPCGLTDDRLLTECDIKRTRRSGPGGQHRNKVETAVVITHQPSGLIAEANERRSQAENRKVAIRRLRLKLALVVRCPIDETTEVSNLWQSRCRRGRISISINHEDYPTILAEALDVIHHHADDWSQVTGRLQCTSSQLIKLLKTEPQALVAVNQLRIDHGLKKFQ